MDATFVLVVFERFAFAAENLPTVKQTIQIIAKQYWNVNNHGVHAKRDHGKSYRILRGMASDCGDLCVCIPARLPMLHYPRLLSTSSFPQHKCTHTHTHPRTHTHTRMQSFSRTATPHNSWENLVFGCLLREISFLWESNLWIHERMCAPCTV